MDRILTAEEFVTLVLAKIKLKANDDFVLDTGRIDQLFEAAYDWLSSPERKLDVTPNFTFRCDLLYGVTSSFRDALLSLRERRMIQPDTSKRAYRISMSEDLAQDYVDHGLLTSDELDQLVREVFPNIAAATPA